MIWRIALAAWLTLLLAVVGQQSHAQFNGCSAGFCSRVSAGAAAYVGPGDIVSGAKAWWGLRCYNTAYVGNVADVYAPADATHTLITCSSGGVLNQTLQALSVTCAISCTVKTLYDQSGALVCNISVACDLSQATIATRPTLVLSCLGSLFCMAFNGSQGLSLTTNFNVYAQPFSQSIVAKRSSGTNQQFLTESAGVILFGFDNAANRMGMYGGGAAIMGIAATDNVWHAGQGVFNGTSSIIAADGTEVADGTSIGTSSTNAVFNFSDISGGQGINGQATEAGFWALSFSAGNRTALNSNQHSYWGF